ncbi:hypothetical protein PG984_003097 [Apiospora sp. TS-2023a]
MSSIKRFVYMSPLAMITNEFHEAVGITPSSWAPDTVIAAARHRPESGLSKLDPSCVLAILSDFHLNVKATIEKSRARLAKPGPRDLLNASNRQSRQGEVAPV